MCVEAAVCCALGLPHSDEPTCVGEAVRSAKIVLNDSAWSSDKARAKGMRRIAIAQLGSDKIDQLKFSTTLAELTIRKILPKALRIVAQLQTVLEHQQKLNEAADRCEADGTESAARAARAAIEAIDARAARAARYAASAARDARDARYAASAAIYAARYASDATSDEMLTAMANVIEEALVICKSPGVKWLDLA